MFKGIYRKFYTLSPNMGYLKVQIEKKKEVLVMKALFLLIFLVSCASKQTVIEVPPTKIRVVCLGVNSHNLADLGLAVEYNPTVGKVCSEAKVPDGLNSDGTIQVTES